MRRLLIAAVVALGVLPATASAGLELGLQDDAYLSSADPRAWQLTRELRPDVIRYNVDWSSVAHARRPRLQLGGDRRHRRGSRAAGRARPAHARAGAGLGQRGRRAARRAAGC